MSGMIEMTAFRDLMASSERYSFSLTTFSPSGKLVQIEYALNAVNAGQPTVGIKAKDGVVVATEKKHKSALQDESTYYKVTLYSSSSNPNFRNLSSFFQ